MDNIKEYVVNYKPNRIPVVSGLEQWDYGQYLVIKDIPLELLEDEKEMHFCFPDSLKSVVVKAEYKDDVLKAKIPKFIFQKQIESCLYSSYKAYAFVYLKTNEYGKTIYRIALEIEVRPKPDDYEYEEEQLYFEELTEVLDAKADGLKYINDVLYLLSGNKTISHVAIKSNDGGVTVETDPTVPLWAKQPKKPTYTAEEVGALSDTTKIPSNISDLNNDSGFVTKLVTDLVNYYTKSQSYSREEIDNKLSAIPKFNIEVVTSLPITNISETTVYLVPAGEDEDNLYTEYINVNGLWEILGTQKIAKFEVTKEDVETALGYTPASETKVSQLEQTVNGMNLSEYETKSDAADKFNTLTNTKAPIVHKHFWSDINDRPFGEDFVTEIIADEQTPDLYGSTGIYASGGLVIQNEPEAKISGETYVVTIDGTAYTCVSWIDAGYDYNTTFIGDSQIWGETEDNAILGTNPENVPFLIEFYFIEEESEFSPFPETVLDSVSIYFPDTTPRTVKIEKKSDEVTVKQIDEKFIPDTIARTEDLRELSNALENSPSNMSTIEPMEDDIPKVFIDGVIPTTKDDVLAEMTYKSKTDEFHAYLKIKCQGSSSMSYDKKNFTIKMYSDEARETKLKKAFKDWKFEQNKYVLKANYIDHSHARNIVSARLWNEVVASRNDYDSLPTELKTSPNNGAIDGFPVKVYTNGTYQGIYTWNIGKDDWMWGMDEDNPNHVLMCGETNTNDTYAETPCNFRALWSGINEQNWSVEVGTNSDSVKTSLNDLISCVKDTDDETFKATIDNHLDVQSAIDYWIHQYIICGLDGLGKNMLIGTYDLHKWIMGAYDMDSTFGLWWTGASFVSSNFRCPEDYQEKYNLLFERITTLYSERVKERYVELRKSVYSTSNMFTHFERFTDVIGKDLYAEDLEIYTGIPSGSTNNIKQIRDYIRDRLKYCDLQFGLIEESDIIYQLAEPMVFDGTSTYLNTGVQLFDEPKDSTLFIDFESGEQSETQDAILMISSEHNSTGKADLSIKKSVSNNYVVFRTSNVEPIIEDVVIGNWSHSWARIRKIALVFKNGLFEYGRYYLTNESQPRYLEKKDGGTFTANTASLVVGARESESTPDIYVDFWKGTVNDFRVYNRALSKEELNALMLQG